MEPGGRTEPEPAQFTQKRKLLRFFLPFSLSFIQKEITQTQPKNHSTVNLHHRRRSGILPPSVALKVRHPSVYLASLSSTPVRCHRSRLLPRARRPSSLSAQPRFRRRLCAVHVRVFVQLSSSFAFFAVHIRSAFTVRVHRSSSHWRSSGSHVALLQTLRPTRALHLAVELLSFVAAVSSLNPPPDNTLTQHQYSASNSAASDFHYNKLNGGAFGK
ncbi:hypothetical protein Ahy_B05g077899 [Arachis hypogaea]|uniref:Uncharacterized protein n=1 Tax=Arachis hypogaea TaxID=3818 RepID=A0A444Z5V2_ARAHY|nr:hypothetical protein Ahy_B05g077899 [Arachis hypogaea]